MVPSATPAARATSRTVVAAFGEHPAGGGQARPAGGQPTTQAGSVPSPPAVQSAWIALRSWVNGAAWMTVVPAPTGANGVVPPSAVIAVSRLLLCRAR